jgi:HD superfamily phosphohydrolase
MEGPEVLDDFQARVNQIVESALGAYDPKRRAKEKSIRDAVWGTSRYYSWEVAILDSPLLQRLRDIRQTGLAYLVYPTALHTRFDHTLGMVAVVSRIVRSINDKHPQRPDLLIQHADHLRVRLSALLHDVGHSCLSHVSEVIFGGSDEFRALTRHVNALFGVTPKPHEIMSWLVVRSTPFQDFIRRLAEKRILPEDVCKPEDVEAMANNIIGYRKDPSTKFLADIVNGPMDADKLDYLVRDAYFAGPTVVYDLERFLQTVDAIEYPREQADAREAPKVVRLSIPIEGVTALEQIIISKLMLFSYLYHHHKIRCVEGMYHEALKRWIEQAKEGKKAGALPPLDHPVCFLALSDRSLLPDAWPPEVGGDRVAGEIVSMLTRRELYKRALVISRLFIVGHDTDQSAKTGFDKLFECGRDLHASDALRQQIVERAREIMKSKRYKEQTRELAKKLQLAHVLLDIPRSPTVEETEGVMVPISSQADRADQRFVPLTDVFPIEKWVDAYNAIKWRGHVFALEEAVPFVNAAALETLRGIPYQLTFTAQATDLCKIPEPIRPDYTLGIT